MTIRAGYFGKSQKLTLSDTPDSFTVQGANESRHTFLVQADVTAFLTRDGSDAADTNGLRLSANMPVLIATFAGDVISYVGESSGSLFVTETDS